MPEIPEDLVRLAEKIVNSLVFDAETNETSDTLAAWQSRIATALAAHGDTVRREADEHWDRMVKAHGALVRRETLERAANIADAIDSQRGNEAEIATAIRKMT